MTQLQHAKRGVGMVNGDDAHAAKKLKSLEEHMIESPYPSFTRPTIEEAHAVYALLAAHYTRGSTQPNVLDSVIGTILSQSTSSQNYTRAKLGEVAHAIKCGGLANKKASTIQTLLKSVQAKHGKYDLQHLHRSEIPNGDAMRELVSYKGVGPKTAACVLSFCLGRQAFAVDTHVFRLTKMLGWVPKGANPVDAQAHLELRIPPELKYGLHVMMVRHGRTCRGCRNGGKGSCPLKAWLQQRDL
ncbi:DNA glycosylase [Pisolithus marmoratus]|nr:DNA glycosylase [Pisolithus marmoratus]